MARDARLVGQMSIADNEMAALDLGGSIVDDELPTEDGGQMEPEFEDDGQEPDVVVDEPVAQPTEEPDEVEEGEPEPAEELEPGTEEEKEEKAPAISSEEELLEVIKDFLSRQPGSVEEGEETQRAEEADEAEDAKEQESETNDEPVVFDRESIVLLVDYVDKMGKLTQEIERQNDALSRLYAKEVERNDRLSALYKKTKEHAEQMKRYADLTKQEKDNMVQAILDGAVDPVNAVAQNVYDACNAAIEAAVGEIERTGVQTRTQLEQMSTEAMERNRRYLQSTAPKKTLIWVKSVGIGVLVVFGLAYLITFVQGLI